MAVESIGITIDQWVETFLPTGFVVNQDVVDRNKKKWQLYLYDAIDPNMPQEDVYDETKWPDLANILIAYLIVYDILMQATTGGYILAVGGGGGSSSSETQGSGAVKKIVTGPTEVQWYDTASSLTQAVSGGKGPNGEELGALGHIMVDACAIANKLGVKLPFCAHAKTVHGFIKAGATPSKCCCDVLTKYGAGLNMGEIQGYHQPVSRGRLPR